MRTPSRAAVLAFTLIELLIVIAVATIVITLAAPTFKEMIQMQRLRSTTSQMVTDIQMARAEAVSRQEKVTVSFASDNGTMSCYVIHTCDPATDLANPDLCACDCSAGEGARCTGARKEVRTVQMLTAAGVKLTPRRATSALSAANQLMYDPTTGGMQARWTGVGSFGADPVGEMWLETSLTRSSPPTLRTMISTAGRPSVCTLGTPASRRVSGVPTC